MRRRRHVLARLLLPVALGVAVYAGLALYGQSGALAAALARFPTWFVAPVLALALANYLLRFVRWQYYLHRCNVAIEARRSAAIFFSGLAMSVTPGRFGELFKCAMLREERALRLSVSIPLVLTERVTDLAAICLLVGIGVLRYPVGRTAFLVVAALVLAVVLALSISPTFAAKVARLLDRVALRKGLAATATADEVATVFATLLRGRALVIGVALGAVAWFAECLALLVVVEGLGFTNLAVSAATFVYALSTLGGAVSLLPGGLGVTEVSMAALLSVFALPGQLAIAGVVIVRLCTLWFATVLGLGVYLLHHRSVARLELSVSSSADLDAEGSFVGR